MFVSLEKGNGDDFVPMADFGGSSVLLKERAITQTKEDGIVELDEDQLLTLCKRAIKKGMFKKGDI